MTIIEQLAAIRDALAAWASDLDAVPEIAASRKDILDTLSGDPTGLKIFVTFTGETLPDEWTDQAVVSRTFALVLVRPFGWTLHRYQNLAIGDASRAPLLWLVEGARNAVMSAPIGEHRDLYPRYTTMSEIDPGELPADVWQLDFTALAKLAVGNEEEAE